MPSGCGKWPASRWRELLHAVLPVLEALPPGREWSLGGGTALALHLGHRVSYDIDVFFENAAALRDLNPNRNSGVRSLADRWQYPGHRIRLERNDGDIDFLIATQLTDTPVVEMSLDARRITVETVPEILAKKLHYRGSRLTIRDTFDLWAAHEWARGGLDEAMGVVPEGAVRAANRIQQYIAGRYDEAITASVAPTSKGQALITADLDALCAVLNSAPVNDPDPTQR